MTLRINNVKLTNVGVFTEFQTDFNSECNIICGPNGIGKTTILDAISSIFTSWSSTSTRNVNSSRGDVSFSVGVDNQTNAGSVMVNKFLREEQVINQGGVNSYAKDVLYIRSNRDIYYNTLQSLNKDPSKTEQTYQSELGSGLLNNDLKNWIANRYLFKGAGSSFTDAQVENYNFLTESFSALDGEVKFSDVQASSYNVMVTTPSGKIPFEYLSSGYRSVMYIILGIIKELEYRSLSVSAYNFAGILLIDEVELHLHPEWQRRIIGVLENIFPHCQMIVTTHSPHVIQAAKPEQVIAISRAEDGSPAPFPTPKTRYGFQGWTIEEILSDVMDLSSTQSAIYSQTLYEFEKSLEGEDKEGLQSSLATLLEMLHPKNPLRKLLRLQAAPVLG